MRKRTGFSACAGGHRSNGGVTVGAGDCATGAKTAQSLTVDEIVAKHLATKGGAEMENHPDPEDDRRGRLAGIPARDDRLRKAAECRGRN